MTCKTCHASNSGPDARPAAGWVNDPDPERDYRLNASCCTTSVAAEVRSYSDMLIQFGYNAGGLYPTVTSRRQADPLRDCHASNALGTAGVPGVPPLTTSMHALHAGVIDPSSGLTLDDSTNRSACYSCHPGSTTKCLRGVMGNAVAADGTLAMQCQSCHGAMSNVGAANRTGWLDEPTCQNCHTGTAIHNNGEIRYTDVYDLNGERRIAVDQTFATTPDVPAPGLLAVPLLDRPRRTQVRGVPRLDARRVPELAPQRQPAEHRACRGMRERWSSARPVTARAHHDQTVARTACIRSAQSWIADHAGCGGRRRRSACRACHGTDYRGTVLSYSKADRTLNTRIRHPLRSGPVSRSAATRATTVRSSDEPNPNHPAVVEDAAASSNGAAGRPFRSSPATPTAMR